MRGWVGGGSITNHTQSDLNPIDGVVGCLVLVLVELS